MDTRDVIMNLQLGTFGVNYEDFHDFGKSYFKYIYKSAYERLDNIIIRNREMLKSKSHGEESRYNEISNVLTFIGKRGTGKTSAMLSFMESLKSYDERLSQGNGEEMFYSFKHEDVLFTCLDCIDGSLLEKGEDIFQIVLAQMYQKFQYLYKNDHLMQSKEGEFGYQARELHKKLEELYKKTCTLDEMSNRHVNRGESYINDLRTLASSQKIKGDFAKLTEEYLEQIRYKHNSFRDMRRQHFLVITVDDIDLNIENGFSMLEKIHRYLMIPNIIVLLSMDYQEMLQICMKNFYKVLLKYDSALRNGEEFVRGVSVDYLDKVLPINYRIYMPDINERYMHYKINGKNFREGVKTLLLGTLFQKTAVVFDSQGRKRHFYEPKSVRVLVDFFTGLDCLENLPRFVNLTSEGRGEDFDGQQKKVYNICEKNYQLLHSDLGTRLAFGMIEKEEQRRFFTEKVMGAEVFRALEMVISYGVDKLKEYGVEKDKIYNYGVLINILYELGRIKDGEYKALTCCLLDYFSYELTKVYVFEHIYIKDETEDKGKNKEKDKGKNNDENRKPIVEAGTFGSFLFGSLIGEWEKEMIPEIAMEKVKEEEVEVSEGIYDDLRKGVKFDTARGRYFSTWFERSLVCKTKFMTNEHTVDLQDIILEMEILFLSLSRENLGSVISGKWGFEIKEKKGSDSVPLVSPELYIEKASGEKFTTIKAQFSIFNFVKNSLYAVSELKQLEEKLIQGFKDYYGEGIEDYISRDKLLAKKYEDWAHNSNICAALPVYSFDLMYNIFKRARRNAKGRNPEKIGKKEVFRYIGDVYRDISEQLETQEKFYESYFLNNKNNNDDKNNKETGDKALDMPKFHEIFEACPYVAYFLEDGDKEQERKSRFMADVTVKMIRGIEGMEDE